MSNDQKNSLISTDSSDAQSAKPAANRVDPLAMTVAQAAKILSAVGNGLVTEEILRRHIAAGAPTTADGKVNLVHYAVWLNKAGGETHGD
ncbi:MAG: hypothetical protein HZA50_12775 [Planctomycetes bacterium]|nr:hypothetical protein [Planctomycetota bacterium]